MLNRRELLANSMWSATGAVAGMSLYNIASSTIKAAEPVRRQEATSATDDFPRRLDPTIKLCHPLNRVPLSFIIDDSTCLVNLAHFAMPQFAATWPDRAEYKKPWKKWPREIPDAFVSEFGGWCADHGVKGKYSIVPNPACVGWLDRDLPGWSYAELQESLNLVRELMVPNWDIHPEMITHTKIIDVKTGRPLEPFTVDTMENWYPRQHKSVDEMAEYLAYALRILSNCELPCHGVTTPGGFGNGVKEDLGLAVRQAVKDVFDVEIAHYFKYVIEGDASTEPTIEHVSRTGDSLDLTVNIPAGTGDWFGGWDGTREVEADRYANVDATSGRMVELIERGQPAFMLCHWPGLYNNGSKKGLHAFQRIVTSLHHRFRDQTIWMKLSEIARYYATKQTISIATSPKENSLRIQSYFSCPRMTFRWTSPAPAKLLLKSNDKTAEVKQVTNSNQLDAGTYLVSKEELVVCVDLPRGESELVATSQA